MGTRARKARDEWIALRCRLGEPEGFEDLVKDLERPLLYYVIKILGDEDRSLDVLQEVWIKVFRSISRLRDPSSLRAWVYKIARGTALNRIRRDKTRERAEESLAESSGDDEGPELPLEDLEALHRALDSLPDRQKEVLVLHFIEDLSLAEIGHIVDAPMGTVKSRIHHGKKALGGMLSKDRHG
jgi:RNA polymerase sigma-70 factor (ECF subfamily)